MRMCILARNKQKMSTSGNVTFASQQDPTRRRNPHPHMMFLLVHGRKLTLPFFQHKSNDYFLVPDYFSNFPLVRKLSNQTASHIVGLLKTIFSEHGIPAYVFTDQERQFVSAKFQEFAGCHQLEIPTSTPKFPQSNRFVKIIKQKPWAT